VWERGVGGKFQQNFITVEEKNLTLRSRARRGRYYE
jgi:hypothetical protein